MTSEAVIPQKKQVKLNRREFLNLAWLASLGIVTAQLGGVTFFFSLPRFKEGEFGGIFTAGSVAQAPEPGAAPTNIPKVKIWLSNSEEGLTAIYKVCTHLGCLYNWSSQEGKFLCPCHGSQFELNGTYIKGPAPRSLDRFHMQIVAQDGSVLAETNEAGDPLQLPDDPNAVIRVDTGRKIIGKTHA